MYYIGSYILYPFYSVVMQVHILVMCILTSATEWWALCDEEKHKIVSQNHQANHPLPYLHLSIYFSMQHHMKVIQYV